MKQSCEYHHTNINEQLAKLLRAPIIWQGVLNPFMLQGIQNKEEFTSKEFESRGQEQRINNWPPVQAIPFPLRVQGSSATRILIVILDGHHRTLLARQQKRRRQSLSNPKIVCELHLPDPQDLAVVYSYLEIAIYSAYGLQALKHFNSPEEMAKVLGITGNREIKNFITKVQAFIESLYSLIYRYHLI